jgi:small subunit ribosomal protein S2
MIDLRLLIKQGVHFGHQTSRWFPKMRPYIWGAQNGIHLIDVSQTAHKLEQAAQFLEKTASEGKSIVWVGTKKAAQDVIQRIGKDLNLPYVVNRWVGGTFTNNPQIKKAIQNLLHYEDILAKSAEFPYSKKELNVFQKNIDRLEKNIGGIRQLRWPVGAVVVVDVKKEHVCIKEAVARGIPVVALVDTNCDPSLINYVIPGNDDVPRAVEIIMNYLAQATKRGLEVAANRPQEQIEQDMLEAGGFENELGLEDDEEKEKAKRRNRNAGRRPANKSAKPADKFEAETHAENDGKKK